MENAAPFWHDEAQVTNRSGNLPEMHSRFGLFELAKI